MPEIVIKPPVRLPIFKDKVMYISPNQNRNKIEQSYVISASFKGIVRLSPNNYNTIYENNPVELTAPQDAAMSSSYSDAIVFEDDALNNTKTNADIRQRMIIGSDSDGYLVDFRISSMDVEFDNLGVIGMTKANDLTIYSDARASEKDALIIGNTVMPSLANKLPSSRALLLSLLNEDITVEIKDYPENYDEIEIDVRGDGDNSYMLHGTKDTQGRRTFVYKNSKQFIRDIIMETLLSFQSVPTGSIHWLPVTYEQYEILVNGGGDGNVQLPNDYYKRNASGERVDIPADPIVRDYLLCDGRRYKSEQFPELAKILWKEQITYWDSEGKLKTEINFEKLDEETQEYPDYFRVPDLRAKFISYCHTISALNSLDTLAYNTQKFKAENWNKTGTYTPDNSPRNPLNSSGESGEHFHFLAYGTYNGYNYKNSRDNAIYDFKGYRINNDSNTHSDPRIWYLQTTSAGQSENAGIGGYSYGFGASGDRRRDQSSQDVITASAFVSAPEGGFPAYQLNPTIGLTSKPVSIYSIPNNNSETYKLTEYEDWTNYIELESGITKTIIVEKSEDIEDTTIPDETLPQRYGFENAPKYYAFLPLIRI